MAETAATPAKTHSWGLSNIAAQLQAKADEVLQSTGSTGSTGTDEDSSGGKREALRNVANIVKEHAGKGIESSKEYLSKVVESVSSYAADASTTVKEKGRTQVSSLSETANTHFTSAKEIASAHAAGLQSNLSKAIAQGQAQGGAASGQTDREIPAETEELHFPFNLIAWFVSLCSKGGSTSTSTASTSKDFSVESLQNAAATLTDTLAEGANSAKAAGQQAVSSATEKAEDARGSGTAEGAT